MQIRWMRFFFVLLFVTLLNAGALLDSVSFGSLHIRPDLLLIMLVFVSINSSAGDAVLASFAIGFAADISGEAMGPYMITYGLFGSFIAQLQKVMVVKKIVHQVMAIFVIGLLTGCIGQLLLGFKMGEPVSNYFKMVSGTAIFSCLVGPLLWFVLSALSLSAGAGQGSGRQLSNR